jgi:NTE family protein
MIKYLVIASGGQEFFKQFSALHTLIKNDFFHVENIEKMYGTSAGSMISLLLSLKLDIDIIYNYIVDRPWEKLFIIDTEKLFSSYDNNGIFHFDLFKKCFEPLIKLTQLKDNFTFKDLYDYSGKKIFCYATNCNSFESKEFSLNETPDISVLKAIYMSSSIPIICIPLKYENIFYIDGFFSSRFPMYEFLKDNSGCNLDEILGVDLYVKESSKINNENIMTFNIGLLNNFVTKIRKKRYKKKIKYVLQVNSGSLIDLYDILKTKQKRIEYLESGKKDAEIFMKYFDL